MDGWIGSTFYIHGVTGTNYAMPTSYGQLHARLIVVDLCHDGMRATTYQKQITIHIGLVTVEKMTS